MQSTDTEAFSAATAASVEAEAHPPWRCAEMPSTAPQSDSMTPSQPQCLRTTSTFIQWLPHEAVPLTAE